MYVCYPSVTMFMKMNDAFEEAQNPKTLNEHKNGMNINIKLSPCFSKVQKHPIHLILFWQEIRYER